MSRRPVPLILVLCLTLVLVLLAGPTSPAPISKAIGPLDDFVIAPEVLANDPAEFRQFRPDIVYPQVLDPDPTIQAMMSQVISPTVVQYDGGLSGEWPVTIGGSAYTITTRHTYSGVPIQKATQYVGEHMDNLGLDIEYHVWNASRPPNVIGQMNGETNPEDIYLIVAHIDDMPSGGAAPGADDNASGTTAVMIAADILSQYRWDCTLRFVFFTGEEQGLLGSSAYAQRSYYAGENILGVLNLDMIAWNTANSSPDIDLHANQSIPATISLAQLFSDVVSTYNLDLIPQIIPSGTGASDHYPFWQYGYPSILAIEDYYGAGDFNPYYHTVQDTLDHTDIDYFTEFVRAAVGTFAHMNGCLVQGETGMLDGHVAAANTSAPIPSANITLDGPHSYQVTTDNNGYYTTTLPVGTYTMTIAAAGYLTTTFTNITIITNTVTTQDAMLDPQFQTIYLPAVRRE
ncbi:MAG: M28 family peptidase [Chloroflexi bacterium]|nr:M28 family peptidase [Chloroflexota bacterium]